MTDKIKHFKDVCSKVFKKHYWDMLLDYDNIDPKPESELDKEEKRQVKESLAGDVDDFFTHFVEGMEDKGFGQVFLSILIQSEGIDNHEGHERPESDRFHDLFMEFHSVIHHALENTFHKMWMDYSGIDNGTPVEELPDETLLKMTQDFSNDADTIVEQLLKGLNDTGFTGPDFKSILTK